MSEGVSIPGSRSVQATLDRVASTTEEASDESARGCVIACPPHPRHGGHRGDARLQAVSNAALDRGIDCLRFDYGEWDDGYGEREDACNALRWATDRYERVGLFGYSFGGAIALLAAARLPELADCVATLAPAATVGAGEDRSAVAAVGELCGSTCVPIQIVYGERDSTVDSVAVVDELETACTPARQAIERIPADHFFVGQHDQIGSLVGSFCSETLAE